MRFSLNSWLSELLGFPDGGKLAFFHFHPTPKALNDICTREPFNHQHCTGQISEVTYKNSATREVQHWARDQLLSDRKFPQSAEISTHFKRLIRRRANPCIMLISSFGIVTNSYNSLIKSTWSSLLNFLPYSRMYLQTKHKGSQKYFKTSILSKIWARISLICCWVKQN